MELSQGFLVTEPLGSKRRPLAILTRAISQQPHSPVLTSILLCRILYGVVTRTPPSPVLFEFIETPVFTGRLERLASRPLDLLGAIQAELIESPTRGDVIPGAHGARKGRIGEPGRGKKGGFRYLYLFVPERQQIFLLFLLDKHEQEDLSPAQKQTVAKLVDVIRGR